MFICIALTVDERGPVVEQEHCFDQHAACICFSPLPPSPRTSPISFQSFLLNTVPTLQQRLLGAQYMWAAHSGERTNFSISETPAAKAKKKPSGPEIMAFPEKSTG